MGAGIESSRVVGLEGVVRELGRCEFAGGRGGWRRSGVVALLAGGIGRGRRRELKLPSELLLPRLA